MRFALWFVMVVGLGCRPVAEPVVQPPAQPAAQPPPQVPDHGDGAHAADMAQFRYVGHEAPDGASYRERAAGASFRTQITHENVGYAWGPGEVHEAFLHSVGHRANLLANDVDRGAVGVAIDPRDPNAFYVTEFFRR